MGIVKRAQLDLDGTSLPVNLLEAEDLFTEDPALDVAEAKDEKDEKDEENQEEVLILVDEVDPDPFDFCLDLVPGGEDQNELDFGDVEVEEDEVEVESDRWKWTINTFMEWLERAMKNIPKHSGKDTAGIERTIAYLQKVDKEISKAVRMDFNGVLDVNKLEKAREEIHKGVERLYDRLDLLMTNKFKKKKKADENSELVKEAKSTRINGITVTVPLLVSGIVRACINSMVSAGKDIEDEFHKLSKEYDLNKREVFEAMQLLADMGYPVRYSAGTDLNKAVDTSSTDNTGWIAQYPG